MNQRKMTSAQFGFLTSITLMTHTHPSKIDTITYFCKIYHSIKRWILYAYMSIQQYSKYRYFTREKKLCVHAQDNYYVNPLLYKCNAKLQVNPSLILLSRKQFYWSNMWAIMFIILKFIIPFFVHAPIVTQIPLSAL